VNIHEGITVKVLLESSTTGMFINRKIIARNEFKLQKLEKPVVVKDVDGTNNSVRAVIYQMEVNIDYKSHVERMRMDICDLGRIDIILGMPWLQVHNPKIN